MRTLVAWLLCSLFALPAHAAPAWTLSGHGGIAVGDNTDPSFAWWSAGHYWVRPALGLGLEGGRHRWSPDYDAFATSGHGTDAGLDFSHAYNSLARGGDEMQHVSLSLRVRGAGRTSSYLNMSCGVYRLRMRGLPVKYDTFHPGMSLGFGGGGARGIAPGAQFRLDLIGDSRDPSAYFTAALGFDFSFGTRRSPRGERSI